MLITRITLAFGMWNPCGGSRSKQLALQCPTMPKGFFRFLAVLLLALTIPVQGLAAVTGAQCMALTHHQDGAGQENHAHDGGADGHDAAPHTHSSDSVATHGDEGSNNHCGPCTACCASASIAGPIGHPILSSPSNTKYVFFQSLPPGVQPDGLDRPPLAL
jgi:hypothetical protein